jgi:hypothetical protein
VIPDQPSTGPARPRDVRDVRDIRASHGADAAQSEASAGFFASLLGRLRARMVFAEPQENDQSEGTTIARTSDAPQEQPAAPAAPPNREALLQPRQRGPRESPQGTMRAIDAAVDRDALQKVGAADDAQRVVQHLVGSISDFCNDPCTQGREGWTVRLELNESVLPQTELEMNLTPQWLLLRFLPRDARSRELVSAGSDSLQKSLMSVMNPQRDVSVSIE